jgi:hypothetical protein
MVKCARKDFSQDSEEVPDSLLNCHTLVLRTEPKPLYVCPKSSNHTYSDVYGGARSLLGRGCGGGNHGRLLSQHRRTYTFDQLLQLLNCCFACLVVTIHNLLLTCFLGWHGRSSVSVVYPFPNLGTADSWTFHACQFGSTIYFSIHFLISRHYKNQGNFRRPMASGR